MRGRISWLCGPGGRRRQRVSRSSDGGSASRRLRAAGHRRRRVRPGRRRQPRHPPALSSPAPTAVLNSHFGSRVNSRNDHESGSLLHPPLTALTDESAEQRRACSPLSTCIDLDVGQGTASSLGGSTAVKTPADPIRLSFHEPCELFDCPY